MRQAVLIFSVRSRHKKAIVITEFMKKHHVRNVIFVGLGDVSWRNNRIVENAIASQVQVLAACDMMTVKHPWPYVIADGTALPFISSCTDAVVSNAVIEHVGGVEKQKKVVEEHLRVGSSWVITTPNRWFPVESHTSVVFRHWSPRWRNNREEFTRLLSLKEFRSLLPIGTKIFGKPWSATFTAMYAPALLHDS